MMLRFLAGATSVVLMAQVSGCTPNAERNASKTATASTEANQNARVQLSTPQDTAAGVEWSFAPTPEERQRVNALLTALRATSFAPNSRYPVRLFRFSESGGVQRYLALGFIEPPADGQYGPALYVLSQDGQDPALSKPYDFKDEENIDVREVKDLDGDRLPDAVFCAWFEAQEEPIRPAILGYRNRRWYTIPAAEQSLPSCTV
jgi:hypothetical protein